MKREITIDNFIDILNIDILNRFYIPLNKIDGVQ